MFAMTLLGFTLSTIWAVFILIIWIMIAFLPASIARSKGRSFWLFFIISYSVLVDYAFLGTIHERQCYSGSCRSRRKRINLTKLSEKQELPDLGVLVSHDIKALTRSANWPVA